MRLTRMTFQDGEEGPIPATVSVEMKIETALLIGMIFGKMSGSLQPAQEGVYDTLIGSVFNRYWDDGTRDAQAELKVEFNAPPPRFLGFTPVDEDGNSCDEIDVVYWKPPTDNRWKWDR